MCIRDSDWTIREITPSEGYLLDSTVYPIGAEAKNYTVEYNTTANDVTEQIIKGKIAIIKHTDDGETQLETPEAGAEFAVFLKAAGSYESAKASERDYLICDENGYAVTKDLPYGIYTVHQAKSWDGRELLADFDVYIAKDGQTYRYLAKDVYKRQVTALCVFGDWRVNCILILFAPCNSPSLRFFLFMSSFLRVINDTTSVTILIS